MRSNLSSGRYLFFGIVLIGIVVLSLFFFLRPKSVSQTVSFNSPVSEFGGEVLSQVSVGTSSTVKPVESENSDGLSEAVRKSLDGTKGNYGVVIKNLKTGEKFEQNAHMIFPPASMYKLWVMAVVFKQIEEGKMSMDTVMSANVVDLNKEFYIDEENAELTDGAFTFTVADALERMIVVSHNYAALMLTDKIGLKSIAPFLRNNGLLESKVGVNGNLPTTTPSDMALFFEKLYSGKLADLKSTNEMIALLKRQEVNHSLPKYLPEETEVAHKTGNLDLYTHDGGIVYSENGDYIIVIMTKSDAPKSAEERMALVSKSVWDWFRK